MLAGPYDVRLQGKTGSHRPSWTMGNMRVAFFRRPCRGVGGNESLAGDLHRGCHNIHGDDPSGWRKHARRATVPDAMPEAAVSAETPGAPALSAAVPEASAAGSGPPLMAQAEIGDDFSRQNGWPWATVMPVQRAPTTCGASGDAAQTPAPVTQDFRYLIYYVWSELPPAEKPAAVVLRSLKDTPVGTPVEEIKRASDAFGLDFNFMKAVAKIESGFDPKQRTGSYIGLFQLSKYEFNKFGSGQILDSRDNAVAAAYKVITEGILFEWVTQKKPTLSDLYLIHQQGWEGAAPAHQPT